MKNFTTSLLTLAVLASMSSVLAAQERPPLAAKSSAPSSPKSDTRATERRNAGNLPASQNAGDTQASNPRSDPTIGPCTAAVNELKASRTLIDALETENAALKTRLESELQLTTVLTELNQTRKNEMDALRTTVAAKNETIAAKDAVIAEQNKLVDALKNKKRSPWARIGDILIGAAVFAILK